MTTTSSFISAPAAFVALVASLLPISFRVAIFPPTCRARGAHQLVETSTSDSRGSGGVASVGPLLARLKLLQGPGLPEAEWRDPKFLAQSSELRAQGQHRPAGASPFIPLADISVYDIYSTA